MVAACGDLCKVLPPLPPLCGGRCRRATEGGDDLFDELEGSGFERLPGMVGGPARSALEAGLAEVLRLPELVGLRRPLSSEPVVPNGRL